MRGRDALPALAQLAQLPRLLAISRSPRWKPKVNQSKIARNTRLTETVEFRNPFETPELTENGIARLLEL